MQDDMGLNALQRHNPTSKRPNIDQEERPNPTSEHYKEITLKENKRLEQTSEPWKDHRERALAYRPLT